jgi:hypothetical protein
VRGNKVTGVEMQLSTDSTHIRVCILVYRTLQIAPLKFAFPGGKSVSIEAITKKNKRENAVHKL